MVIPVNKFQLPFNFIGSLFENVKNWINRLSTSTYSTAGLYDYLSYSSNLSVYLLCTTSNVLYKSSDGISWSTISVPLAGYMATSVHYFNGYFYLGISDINFSSPTLIPKIYRSSDASTWSLVYTFTSALPNFCFKSISDDGTNLIAYGDTYTLMGGTSGVPQYIFKSTGGSTWSISATLSSSTDYVLSGKLRYINGTYVIFGWSASSRVLTSTNLTSWVYSTIPGVSTHEGKVISGYLYLVTSGGLYRTNNGTTWTLVFPEPTGYVMMSTSNISFGNNLYVLRISNNTATGHGVWTSIDGISWVFKLNYSSSGGAYYLTYGDKIFVGAGGKSSSTGIDIFTAKR